MSQTCPAGYMISMMVMEEDMTDLVTVMIQFSSEGKSHLTPHYRSPPDIHPDMFHGLLKSLHLIPAANTVKSANIFLSASKSLLAWVRMKEASGSATDCC